jgi:hypothetical protein
VSVELKSTRASSGSMRQRSDTGDWTMRLTRKHTRWLVAAVFLVAACSRVNDVNGPADGVALDEAFVSIPLAYNNVLSSFAGGPDGGMLAWGPGGHGHGGPRGTFMLGGGLADLFLGGGFGAGFGHGRFGDPRFDDQDCAFNAATGRLVCVAVTHNGITVNRSVAYRDAGGSVQPAFDSATTNSINVKVDVSGTFTRRDSATTTVQHASDRTVSGLAAGSTQRTVNGTSTGRENTSGSNDKGAFTVVRVVADTTRNVVIPVSSGTRTYPTAGIVIRAMSVTLTYAGQTPTTSVRREVVSYDGTNTAKVTITKDGETKTCTLPLPRGRLTCE